MLIKVVDAGTGTPVAAGYTGLRMGANYAWPRGAKWLMERRVMASFPANDSVQRIPAPIAGYRTALQPQSQNVTHSSSGARSVRRLFSGLDVSS